MSKADWLALTPLAGVLLAAVIGQLIAFGTKPARVRRRVLHMLEVLEKRADHELPPPASEAWERLEEQVSLELYRYMSLESNRDDRFRSRLAGGFIGLLIFWMLASSAVAVLFGTSVWTLLVCFVLSAASIFLMLSVYRRSYHERQWLVRQAGEARREELERE